MITTNILIFLSIAPSIVILLFIYIKDKYEKEPLNLLLKSFGLGALSAICVIAFFRIIPIEIDTMGNHFADSFVTAFFIAAIPEELFKFLFLYWLIWKNRNFNERFDGIIYAVFVSLGFATLENIIYVLQGGISVGLIRAFTAVPAHALFGVAMGFYFSYAKFLPEYKNKYLVLTVGVPIVLHGVYDFFAIASNVSNLALSALLALSFYVFVVFLWIYGFRKIKKMTE
jgi:RsiW-degrading membrane proteinase PrsW (M82 family)